MQRNTLRFVANHLQAIGGGRTSAELGAQAQDDPDDTKLAPTLRTVSQGVTPREPLLNGYASSTKGLIAGTAGITAAAVMLALAVLGLVHTRRAPAAAEVHTADGDHAPTLV